MRLVNQVQGHKLMIGMAFFLIGVWLLPSAAQAQRRDYAVEVAALRSQDCAIELANGLQARGFEAYWLKGNQPEHGEYYRVRVGRFQNLDLARTYAENLLDSGLLEACAITFYEAPGSSLIKISTGLSNTLQAELAGLPIVASCPVKLPNDPQTESPNNRPTSPEELISLIGKNKWLLSSNRSVIYTPPPKRTAKPVNDVVVLMRSIDRNRWRLSNDLNRLVAPPVRPAPSAAPLVAANTSSSISAALPAAAANTTVIREVNNLNSLTAESPRSTTGGAATGIDRIGNRAPARSPYLSGPKVQGVIEMRDGRLMMRLKNNDQQRSFSGVVRVTVSDDKDHNDVTPMNIVLQPDEEKIVPVNETTIASGDWMLMVYDERQAVQLIRSAPFGNRPKVETAATQPAGQPDETTPWKLTDTIEGGIATNGLPNVTGTFDATGPANPPQTSNGIIPPTIQSGAGQPNTTANNAASNIETSPQQPVGPGQVRVAPRQIAVTTESITMEFEISSPRALGYITVVMRAGNYLDERHALMSTPNGRVPFLVPATETKGPFTFEVKDEAGRSLAAGTGSFQTP